MERPFSDEKAASYFWKIFESNAVPIEIWDTSGKIYEANQALLDFIGYTREEFEKEGLNWKQLTAEESKPLDDKSMQELRYKKASEPYIKTYRRKDGKHVHFMIYNAIFKNTESKGFSIIIPQK